MELGRRRGMRKEDCVGFMDHPVYLIKGKVQGINEHTQ